MSTHIALVFGTVLFLTADSAFSQFMVDAAGPRNVFNSGTNQGFDLSLQTTATPSLDLDYFTAPFAIPLLTPKDWTTVSEFAFDAKMTANNGLSDFIKFDQIPQLNFSALFNHSWWANDTAPICSLTTRFTEEYGDYALFDTTRGVGTQSYSRTWLGEAVTETFSIAPFQSDTAWAPFALALSFGFVPTNNFAVLPQATLGSILTGSGKSTVVGSGKTVHYGKFYTYNSLPITFLPTYSFGDIAWLKGFPGSISWLEWTHWSLLKSTNDYNLIVAPYVAYAPASISRPADTLGLNLVIEKTTPPPVENGMKRYDKVQATFPFSLFIQRQNAFLGKPSMLYGAALTYHFP